MKVVLDTSVLIYWTLDPEKLTQPAAFAIENAEQIIVSCCHCCFGWLPDHLI
jgi:PIN domain nuclease of toxin-antitoxin system